MSKCGLCQNKPYCEDSLHASETCKANGYEAFSPCTNADRIRAMTDEELAKWFCVMNADDCPDKAHELHCMDKCYECWLDWLKCPVWVEP